MTPSSGHDIRDMHVKYHAVVNIILEFMKTGCTV